MDARAPGPRVPVFKRLVKLPASSSSRIWTLLFFPNEKITKGGLIAYYRQVADVLLPHLRKKKVTEGG